MPIQVSQELASVLQLTNMENTDKYLGHMLLLPKSWISSYNGLLDKVRARLKGWKSKHLSHAGRTSPITSTLGSIPIYFMSAYNIPRDISHKLGVHYRAYWWGDEATEKKMHFCLGTTSLDQREKEDLDLETQLRLMSLWSVNYFGDS